MTAIEWAHQRMVDAGYITKAELERRNMLLDIVFSDPDADTLAPPPMPPDPEPVPATERETWTTEPQQRRCYFCFRDARLCREHTQPPRVP